jgi:CRP-like cAMP-binding protein
MFPTLAAPHIAPVAQHGHIREVGPGDVPFDAGQTIVPFFVITIGQIEIVRPASTGDTVSKRQTYGRAACLLCGYVLVPVLYVSRAGVRVPEELPPEPQRNLAAPIYVGRNRPCSGSPWQPLPSLALGSAWSSVIRFLQLTY